MAMVTSVKKSEMKTKICNKCGKEKAISKFSKNRFNKDSFFGCCKICVHIRRRKYIEDNPEKVKAIRKSYRERNLEKFKARGKKYRQENPEKIKAYQKKYRHENPEKIKGCQKKYRDQNPEKERVRHQRYSEQNPEKIKACQKKYRIRHPERCKTQARVSYERFRNQQPGKYKLRLTVKRDSYSYARHLLSYRTALEPADIPDELVELKLAQIKLNRLIKKGA